MKNRNETRQEILDFIKSYFKQHGYAPSITEICEGCNVKSSSSVHNHIQRLFRDGELLTEAEMGAARAFRVNGFHIVEGERV